MATVLEEMGVLVRTRPVVNAPAGEVAAWYARKATMLRQIAAAGGPDAARATAWAEQAAGHAAALIAGPPTQGTGAALEPGRLNLADRSRRRRLASRVSCPDGTAHLSVRSDGRA